MLPMWHTHCRWWLQCSYWLRGTWLWVMCWTPCSGIRNKLFTRELYRVWRAEDCWFLVQEAWTSSLELISQHWWHSKGDQHWIATWRDGLMPLVISVYAGSWVIAANNHCVKLIKHLLPAQPINRNSAFMGMWHAIQKLTQFIGLIKKQPWVEEAEGVPMELVPWPNRWIVPWGSWDGTGGLHEE